MTEKYTCDCSSCKYKNESPNECPCLCCGEYINGRVVEKWEAKED